MYYVIFNYRINSNIHFEYDCWQEDPLMNINIGAGIHFQISLTLILGGATCPIFLGGFEPHERGGVWDTEAQTIVPTIKGGVH